MAVPIVAGAGVAAAGYAASKQQQPTITISNGNSTGGIPWYGWVLIALVILAAIFFIAPFVIEKIGELAGIAKEGIWNAALASPLGGILGFFFPEKGSNSNNYSARKGSAVRNSTGSAFRAIDDRNPFSLFRLARRLR